MTSLPERVEQSIDITQTLRLIRLGKVYLIEERDGISWTLVARIDGPKAYTEAYETLHRFSKENAGKILQARAAHALPPTRR